MTAQDNVREPGRWRGKLVAAAFLSLLLAGCAQEQPQQMPPPQVEVVVVRTEPIANVIELPGRVQAVRTAEVRARVTGIVGELLYHEGSDVRAGQPLFAIDPRELQASLAAVQATLQRAEASATNARQDVERYRPLLKDQAISKQEYDMAVARLNTAEADVLQARAQVASGKLALGYAYVVRARDGGLSVASSQAARMATLMSADDRAKGEAVAAALASGKPVTVALAEASVPRPGAAPVQMADASAVTTGAETEDEAEEGAPEAPPKAPARKPAPEKAEPKGKAEAKAKVAEKDDQKAEGWKVQLGAYANESAARTAWATLVSQSAELLKGRKPIYAPRGNLVRLQVGPYGERGDAAELCAKLAAAGRPCFVTR